GEAPRERQAGAQARLVRLRALLRGTGRSTRLPSGSRRARLARRSLQVHRPGRQDLAAVRALSAHTEDTRMAKKILSILSHTEYGNLEDSDIGLFASAFAPVAGQQLTMLLREDAVNYAVRGQDGTGIKIAGTPIQPGFLIETDLRSLNQANIA